MQLKSFLNATSDPIFGGVMATKRLNSIFLCFKVENSSMLSINLQFYGGGRDV